MPDRPIVELQEGAVKRLARTVCGPTQALLAALVAACAWTGPAQADNAGFALAPRSAWIAIDARGATDVVGVGGAALRPILEAIAGEQALVTFDTLARRSGQAADAAAREVFAGRIAFYITEGPAGASSWLCGLQADNDRCDRVLRLLNARMQAPGRFVSATQGLLIRRAGGWLLIAPKEVGEAALDAAAARAAVEDPGSSLLGEPLIQEFLASDAPVRIFARHSLPIGGATMIGISRTGDSLRAELCGSYESSPLGQGARPKPLRAPLVRAFEDIAAMVVANPSDGTVGSSDGFWIALVPELNVSPAMRANLAGERILAIGTTPDRSRPALALAWLVEDAEQSRTDQDAYMHGVCCGMLRAAESPAPSEKPPGAPPQPADVAREERVRAIARRMADQSYANARACEALGPFLDRYLGAPFKLGETSLCWNTVPTACGGWQIYATDRAWLALVSQRLTQASCGEAPAGSPVAGLGFLDGPRAAAIIRAWKPLVADGSFSTSRVGRGLEALASAVAGLGRVRFAYETPCTSRVRATIELEPAVRPAGPPTDRAPTALPAPAP